MSSASARRRKRRRKSKLRWGTLGAIATAISGVIVTIASDPQLLAAAGPRIGLGLTLAGAIVAGVKKAVTRDETER